MKENPIIALQTDSAANVLMCLVSWLPEHSNRHRGDPPLSMRSHLISCPTLNDYCYLIFVLRSRWLMQGYTQAYSAARPSWLPWESTASSQNSWDFCCVYQHASPATSLFLCCVSFLNLPVHDWGVIIVVTRPIRLWKLWVGSSGLLSHDCFLAVKMAPTKCIFQASTSSFCTTVWRCCLMGWNTAWGCSPHIGQENILEDTRIFFFWRWNS